VVVTVAQTPAERARAYRRRLAQHREPRTVSDDPLARARRRRRAGVPVDQLEPDEAAALRQYNAERARARRRGE
jgi:hypothetical protein